MGEPIIIWPPDGGNFGDWGDSNTLACQNILEMDYVVDCSAQAEQAGYSLGDSGLACCVVGE